MLRLLEHIVCGRHRCCDNILYGRELQLYSAHRPVLRCKRVWVPDVNYDLSAVVRLKWCRKVCGNSLVGFTWD